MSPDDLSCFFPIACFGQVNHVVPVTIGQSGAKVYSASTDAGDYILRIHSGDDASWSHTLSMNTLAAHHSIAPPLVHVALSERATVSEKIIGVPFGAALAQPESRTVAFQDLLHVLNRLHNIPFAPQALNDPLRFAQAVWNEQVQRQGFPSWATSLGIQITEARNLLAEDKRLVLSHCDLNPANILWDGTRVWLVVWERAGPAHPYLDLATISVFLSLTDDVGLALLQQQEQCQLDNIQKRLFTALRDLCGVVYGVVFFSLTADLTSVEMPSCEETIPLHECFAMLSAGSINLGQSLGRAIVGAALLKRSLPPVS